MMLTRMVSVTITKSLFPVFSKLQDDKEQFQKLFNQALTNVEIVSFAIFGVVAFSSEAAIGLVLGEQWLPMVPYFQVLCLFGVVYVQNSLFINVNNSLGKTRVVFRTNLVSASFRIVTLLLLVFTVENISPLWFIVVQIVFMILVSIYLNYFIKVKNGIDVTNVGRFINYGLVLVLITGVLFIGRYFETDNVYLEAIYKSSLFIIPYLGVSYFINKNSIVHLGFNKLISKWSN